MQNNMDNYRPEKIKAVIDSLELDEFPVYIGTLNEDIEHLDITRDDYWEVKAHLLQHKCWAWERFARLQNNQHLGFTR